MSSDRQPISVDHLLATDMTTAATADTNKTQISVTIAIATTTTAVGNEADANDSDSRFQCDCRFGPDGQPCCRQFDGPDIADHRLDCQSCDYWDDHYCYNLLNERIIAIMSVLIDNSRNVVVVGGGGQQSAGKLPQRHKRRQKSTVRFLWRGRPVCKSLFLYVHGITKPKWTYLKKRYHRYGVEPREHQNKVNPVNNRAINTEERKSIADYIVGYAKQNARNPDARQSDRWLLPATQSIKSVYRVFAASGQHRAISYEAFRNVWRRHCQLIGFDSKNDRQSVAEFIKSYAKRHAVSNTTTGTIDEQSMTVPSPPGILILPADCNVKTVYTEFQRRHPRSAHVSYDVFNSTWKALCADIRFANTAHYGRRKCSHCGAEGHTNRKIGDHFLCPLRESQSGLSGLMRKARRKPQ
ncbi:uncharacterized protein LOC128953878 [Oppia nitens]|uniref:uncharacterized protein LOC128953878 n=1 Tax=Oppia nitens TaxID=1686743 RepID=UPI0023DA317A|nr:uncharacterized protein LOC128953878 [Oppia nitens]